ncbi:MAG TPA: hypothetical protein VEP90_05460, partial [Methylomirabilota bacterium]|nr:hypothetical protein [Methylomirabilota bacterium]
FDVFSIPNGLYIAPTRDAPDFMYDPPNRILHVIDKTDLDDPELSIAGVFQETFTICPGSEGKQLFVNPDGVPIREVTIEVSNQRPIQSLEIQTKLPHTSQSQRNTYRHVSYDFREKNDILAERSPLFLENNLRIVRAYSLYDAMTDAYATHLFNTIDGLIPGAPAPHQSGRRPTPELIRAPRQLPAPRRTPTRRT